MTAPAQFLNPSEAAKRLGVSVKALRLYEQRGLVMPMRTGAGWRVYGPDEMTRIAEIAALRQLGLSLGDVARVLEGDATALATHQAVLEGRLDQLAGVVEKVRRIRTDLAHGKTPAIGDLALLMKPASSIGVAFELPWPWGGEFLLTRSSAVLDLDAVGRHEAIILCPANHSAPTLVTPHRGAPGYEAVATCLASPEVRARTEGVVAVWRPATAASA